MHRDVITEITGCFDAQDRIAVDRAHRQGYTIDEIILAVKNAESFYKNNNMQFSREHGNRLKASLILKNNMTIKGFLNYDSEKAGKKMQKLQSRFQAIFNARKHLLT